METISNRVDNLYLWLQELKRNPKLPLEVRQQASYHIGTLDMLELKAYFPKINVSGI